MAEPIAVLPATARASAMALAFLAANRQSPLVYGSAKGRGGQGGTFRLANGMTFQLTAADLRAIGQPRWQWQDVA